MEKKIIVISRQYGSGGREVGKIISEDLGIPFYDNKLIMLAAQNHGLDLGVLKNFDEKKMGSFLYYIAMMSSAADQEKVLLPYQIYNAQRETILALAQEGPCIIIGRCADYILKGKFDFLNVFIYASNMQDKIERAMRLDNIPEKDAAAYVIKKDKQRKEYHNFYANTEWGQMTQYDICLNSSALGIDGCVRAIKSII